jgi:hypothetical protein
MTRGVLMYAHNNTEIDYFKIACANALMVQKNLKVPVTLVTDEGTLGYSKSVLGEEFVNSCFEKVILADRDYTFQNQRNFSDTSYSVKNLQFYNANHWAAYELSPYDETLFIDADYLIMSSALENCWGSDNDVMINHDITSPFGESHSKIIDEFGIRLYWATVIYFRKSDFAKFLFDLVREIQENYTYYRDLYCFSSGMYRNDNAFSIAIHMLNGFSEDSSVVAQLPITALMMCWDTGDILSINGINDISLYVEKDTDKGQYTIARFKNTDVHIMNKWSISRNAGRLIEIYK